MAGSVFMVQGSGGNIGVSVGADGILIVDDLKAFHAMLVETIGLVRQRMKSGKTLDQIQAEGLPEKWNSWGAGFVNTKTWINIVYQSLSKPR